jgi:hypothetical protein
LAAEEVAKENGENVANHPWVWCVFDCATMNHASACPVVPKREAMMSGSILYPDCMQRLLPGHENAFQAWTLPAYPIRL